MKDCKNFADISTIVFKIYRTIAKKKSACKNSIFVDFQDFSTIFQLSMINILNISNT